MRPLSSLSETHGRNADQMPLVELSALEPLFACPHCRGQIVRTERGFLCLDGACTCGADDAMPMVGRHPVLVDFDSSVLTKESVVTSGAASPGRAQSTAAIAAAHRTKSGNMGMRLLWSAALLN